MKELKTLIVNGTEYAITDAGAARATAVGDMETALEAILAMQSAMLGGDGA